MVGIAKCEIDYGALDRAVVQEAELVLSVRASDTGWPDEAADLDPMAHLLGDVDQPLGELVPGDSGDALAQVTGGWQLEDEAIAVPQSKCDVRVGDRVDAHLLLDVAELGRFGAQELAPSWDVVEQRAHLDLCAWSLAAVVNVPELAPIDIDLGAAERVRFPGGKAEARDAGDRGECLAAEAEGRDIAEVLFGVEFAGRMAFEAQQGVVARHAVAVVEDADQ